MFVANDYHFVVAFVERQNHLVVSPITITAVLRITRCAHHVSTTKHRYVLGATVAERTNLYQMVGTLVGYLQRVENIFGNVGNTEVVDSGVVIQSCFLGASHGTCDCGRSVRTELNDVFKTHLTELMSAFQHLGIFVLLKTH